MTLQRSDNCAIFGQAEADETHPAARFDDRGTMGDENHPVSRREAGKHRRAPRTA